MNPNNPSPSTSAPASGTSVRVSDILRLKGSTLYTSNPEESLHGAIQLMAEKDIGSLVIMEGGALAGMLTFREVIGNLAHHKGSLTSVSVRAAMNATPQVCSLETSIDDVRRLMLEQHARYIPVMDGAVLMGVISFYDVAKAVVDAQNFENSMLKAYIRDWPQDHEPSA